MVKEVSDSPALTFIYAFPRPGWFQGGDGDRRDFQALIFASWVVWVPDQ